jgi:membrane-bound lytic murein transglycosylase B
MKLSKSFVFIGCALIAACSGNGAPVDSTVTQDVVKVDERPASQESPAIPSSVDPVAAVVSQQPILPTIPDAQLEQPESERFARFVAQLKVKAQQEGISQPVIDKAFANVTLLKRVIASDKNQLEKKIMLDDYLKRVLTQRRMTQAKEMYQLNAELLSKASAAYGVPANYIVALWGMESNFGRLQGKENIISAMASLAFEGRREAFFTDQLMAALHILQDDHIEIENFKGSWAGAMGQCQFMPSSFIKYGADGDGDGKIDIWNNKADVFASTANYLSSEGWNGSQRWGREVTLPQGFDHALSGLEDGKAKSVAEWQKLGVQISASDKGETEQEAWIILPDDSEGRAFIAYGNFKTLMHWNRSYYFAISVGMLADSIVE